MVTEIRMLVSAPPSSTPAKVRKRNKVYGSGGRRKSEFSKKLVGETIEEEERHSNSSSSEEVEETKSIPNPRRSARAKKADLEKKDEVVEIPDDESNPKSDMENEENGSIASSAPSSLSPLQTKDPVVGQSRISVSKKSSPATPSQKIKKNTSNATIPDQSNIQSNKKDSSTTPKKKNNSKMEEVDVIFPPHLWHTSTCTEQCTVMIQVEPHDASVLDFHGASGAVGRFEADDSGVTMDLKGFQYSGIIHPGPTAMVLSMHPMQSTSISNCNGGPVLKVESITDEFVTLTKSRDMMATLDAVVEKGDMDESYFSKELNVNIKERPGPKDAVVDDKGKEEGQKTPTKRNYTKTQKKNSSIETPSPMVKKKKIKN